MGEEESDVSWMEFRGLASSAGGDKTARLPIGFRGMTGLELTATTRPLTQRQLDIAGFKSGSNAVRASSSSRV